ncbi:MAG: PLD nuclease N-terminal domain-containing protein [Actinomycetota bacterium]|nr:PLD nuclease N-terminal domain-containing protein [Actinomycetota bacterium]
MVEIDGIFGLLLLALWIYCIFDVITTDESLIRNLPKLLWLMIVVVLPDIGSIIWLVAGRPHGASFRPGDTSYGAPARRAVGPEDRADFTPLSRERDERDRAELRVREEQLRRREEEVRRRELAAGIGDEDPPPPTPPSDS